MPETSPPDGPPPFDAVFEGEDVEQRVYGTILQTREPTTARVISEQALCDPKSARKYLEWFADLGIVTRYDGQPVTYERNDAYFEWRRINQLAAEHTVEELKAEVRELTNRITDHEAAYDAARPADVDAIVAVEDAEGRTIDDVYSDLADWETALTSRRLYERARQQRTRGTAY